MTPALSSPFVFATCQLGAERALKAEVARRHPRLRFAFSRPGFLTWKSEQPLEASFDLDAALARASGLSFVALAGEDDAARAAAGAARLRELSPGPWTLHVFERDPFEPGREPEGFVPNARSASVEAALRAALGSAMVDTREPARGALVADLVLLAPDAWWLGAHLHGPRHAAYPGGIFTQPLPAAAPSRAYLKLVEAAARFAIPLAAGDTALEIGSAPGGAALALLERGVSVYGVDAAQMSPTVLAKDGSDGGPRFVHLAKSVGQLERRELPASIEWLLIDINAEPDIALAASEPIARELWKSLCGVILTLKLSDWSLAAELERHKKRVEAWGPRRLIAKQLYTNRRELLLYGLTHRGAARASAR